MCTEAEFFDVIGTIGVEKDTQIRLSGLVGSVSLGWDGKIQ
jgi:hypothetical protein